MKAVGLIVEFNPFHYGHKYYIEKVKEMFPGYVVICVMSGHFTERGDLSVINKWDKTSIALDNGIDIVIELPFVFASSSADLFSKGAIELLNSIGVSDIVFGSECDDINKLYDIAKKQIKNDSLIKKEMSKGISYPKAVSNVNNGFDVDSPNDTLGICYIKEILLNKYNIKAHSIKRTSDFNSLELKPICSSSSIRKAIDKTIDISDYVPYDSKLINNKKIDDYFEFIKYKIISSKNLSKYMDVSEGLENRLKKYVLESNSLEDFISKIKCKRYTYNRIKRICVHILCGLEKNYNLHNQYIRILGFNSFGQKYLSSIKKKINLPIVYSYKENISSIFDMEYVSSLIYDYDLGKLEYKNKVIKK